MTGKILELDGGLEAPNLPLGLGDLGTTPAPLDS
jgi:hypothetical protein